MRIFQLLTLIFVFSLNSFGQINTQEISKYIESARAKYEVPGLSVAIVKDGQILFEEGFGTLEKGGEIKADEHTLYAIASNTKAFVSSALAVLVAEEKLKWDDKVVDYIPDFELYDDYSTQNTTIEDLLCHRAGLGTYSGDAIWYKTDLSGEEVVRQIKNVPQAYNFRNGYGYSNLMFITAGEVIRKVTGMSWDRFVSEQFLQPLDMNRTITSTTQLESLNNIATPHKTREDIFEPINWTNWDNMGAAGGIISSVHDMSKWMIMQLNKGTHKGASVLDPVQQNKLWTIHNNFTLSSYSKAQIPGRHFSGYGLGWGLQDYFGRMMVSHGGGYDGMYSRVVMIPDENLGVVILTNSMSGISTPLSYYLLNQFIKEDTRDWVNEFYRPVSMDQRIQKLRQEKKEGTKAELKIKNYAGNYTSKLYGEIRIMADGKKLRLEFANSSQLSAQLVHWHDNIFEIKWDETHAWFDFGLLTFNVLNGQIENIKINVPNYDIFFDEDIFLPKK